MSSATSATKIRTAHHKVLRNIASNWVGYGINMSVGFFLSPLLVHRLGDVSYGVWAMAVQLGAYMSVLDFGIRVAVTRFLTQHSARNERARINAVISVALLLLGSMGLLCMLVAIPIAWITPLRMGIPSALVHDARIAILLIGASVAVTFPGALYTGALAAVSRYDLINVRNSLTAIVRAAALWYALTHDYGLVAVAAITGVTSFLGYLCEFVIASRVFGGFTFRLEVPSMVADAKTLFSFSIFAFLLSISTRLLLWSDNVVVGFVLGPVAVTHYSIGGNLVDYFRTILSSITSVFVPLASAYDATNDSRGLKTLLVSGSRFTLGFLIPGIVGLFTIGGEFISLWVGPRYVQTSLAVMIVLAIPLLFAPLQATCNQVLYGMSKHRVYSYIAISEAVVNLVLSIVLARRIGLLGVAWGSLIPALIAEGILLPIFTARTVGVSATHLYWQSVFKPIITSLPCAAFFYWTSHSRVITNWASFVTVALAGMCIHCVCAWSFGADESEREIVRERVRMFRTRFSSAES